MRYEVKELSGKALQKVVSVNKTLLKDKTIYGIYDNQESDFVVGDEHSLSYYYWTTSKSWAEIMANKINLTEVRNV